MKKFYNEIFYKIASLVKSHTDLKTLASTNSGNLAGTVTFNGNQTATITGSMVFNNLQEDTQNDLMNLNAKVTVSFSNFSCTSTISGS